MEDLPAIKQRRFTGGVTELEVEANNFCRLIFEFDRRFPGLGRQSGALVVSPAERASVKHRDYETIFGQALTERRTRVGDPITTFL